VSYASIRAEIARLAVESIGLAQTLTCATDGPEWTLYAPDGAVVAKGSGQVPTDRARQQLAWAYLRKREGI
jgi:hypothetical protein